MLPFSIRILEAFWNLKKSTYNASSWSLSSSPYSNPNKSLNNRLLLRVGKFSAIE